MMKNISFYLLVIILTSQTLAQEKTVQRVPPTMYSFLEEIKQLQPFMISTSEFTNKKNESLIQAHLNNLSDISSKLKHESKLEKPFFRVMTEILPQHLEELKDSFQSGQKEHARFMLKATLDGCASCHSQVKGNNPNLWRFSMDNIQGTPFEKAEFMHAVRHYDEALSLYRQVIEDFKSSAAEPISSDVLDSLFKKLSILIRSKGDLKLAKKELHRDIENKNLPEIVTMSLVDNLATIQQMENMKVPDPIKSKSKDLENFAAKVLSRASGIGWLQNRNYVAQMYVESVLYDFVQNHDSLSIGPGIYYWLAKCEKKTSTSFYFPIAEFYLKECIEHYPLSYEAKLCFNDLENLMIQNTTARAK